ncbi:caspase family protein [Bradyrhizobium monzae]|uniref:caspase family protein n=1 Tax=Bradyrhizobium sp. Oc8 TaxID=2876780 RepID=UPI001F29E709|nr:caspase domain-containing protein [Bradyrhizobium sp. Oc8]
MPNRIGLVIGNSKYAQSTPLRNPVNDALAIAAVLRKLEFNILIGLNLDRDSMEDKLGEFEGSVQPDDTALIYYAGHGLQVNGHNYLIPIDADIRLETHLRRRAFSLDELLSVSSNRARTSLIFLDACRDNPFSRSLLQAGTSRNRSGFEIRAGLAEVRVKRGSFIAFATAPDNVASDGEGHNSPFTTALVTHLESPNVSVSDMMINVRNDVLRATNYKQEPWDQSSLQERFCFSPLPQGPSKAPPRRKVNKAPRQLARRRTEEAEEQKISVTESNLPPPAQISEPEPISESEPTPAAANVSNEIALSNPPSPEQAMAPPATRAESIELTGAFLGRFHLRRPGLVGLNRLALFLNDLQDQALIGSWQVSGWEDYATKMAMDIKFGKRADAIVAISKYNEGGKA